MSEQSELTPCNLLFRRCVLGYPFVLQNPRGLGWGSHYVHVHVQLHVLLVCMSVFLVDVYLYSSNLHMLRLSSASTVSVQSSLPRRESRAYLSTLSLTRMKIRRLSQLSLCIGPTAKWKFLGTRYHSYKQTSRKSNKSEGWSRDGKTKAEGIWEWCICMYIGLTAPRPCSCTLSSYHPYFSFLVETWEAMIKLMMLTFALARTVDLTFEWSRQS